MKNKNLSGGLFAHKPTPLTIRETTLSAQIAEVLSVRGFYNDRLNSGMVRTSQGRWIHLCKKGTPDRLAIVRGLAIFIEVKQRGKKPTQDQLDRHDELRRAGAFVLVVDSLEQFLAELDAILENAK